MSKYLNVVGYKIPEGLKSTDDLILRFREINLGTTDTDLISEEKEKKIGEIKESKFDNIFLDSRGIPQSLSPVKSVKKVDGEPNKETQTNFIWLALQLALTDSEILFQEKYYRTRMGGHTFYEFYPQFGERSFFQANSLVVSRSKFNVVYMPIVHGQLKVGEGQKEVIRLNPFKFVKQGKLQFDEIIFKLTEKNEHLKEYLKGSQMGEMFIADLSNMPVFPELEQPGPVSVANGAYALQPNLIVERTLRFVVDMLEEEMEARGIRTLTEDFYTGILENPNYVSDAGSDYLEVWIKGSKTTKSVNTMLEGLGELGFMIYSSLELVTGIDDYKIEKELEPGVIERLQENLKARFQDKSMDRLSYIMLTTMVSALKIEGSLIERLMTFKRLYKQSSKTLQILNLKMMALRYKLLDVDPLNIGEARRSTGGFQIPVGNLELVVKQGKISTISSDIEE